MNSRIDEWIRQMTVEEKASLCSGADFWHTKAVERLGIPATMVTDGPHGLRKQAEEADHLGINDSIKAVCFPAGCATAASFNRELLETMGKAIGNQCQAENVSVVLGPAVNIKRSPLCGRNFEYYSEDPFLASEMATGFIRGVQSQNVGTSIKHFLANNQETRRMSSSSNIDDRTLREIYLAAFEGAVKKAKPWTVMCSYNKINGVYAAENKTYLTDILRGEWGFDGYVMSDWGAVNARVEDLEAGLDLEMPSSNGINDALIVAAVKDGSLSEMLLDEACRRILTVVMRYHDNRNISAVFSLEEDHQLACKIAGETIVLLKNSGGVLPLNKSQKVAFIGQYAAKPRYQGGGSSHISSFKVSSALDAVAGWDNITYAQGFADVSDEREDELFREAVETARRADVAVIFAGLPDRYESEGYDRQHLRMPAVQNQLIREIAAVQPNTVVVLHNGSPVEMPWLDEVKGLLEAYLSGQGVGQACVDILFGDVNPSAKLPETFPLRLEDSPTFPFYPGDGDTVNYNEGVFVGYRYYNSKKMDVLFPFGFGLSYTSFEYSNLQLSKTETREDETVTVTVDITNTGSVRGKEIVQLYVAPPESEGIRRPEKELRDFAKIELKPGETKSVSFVLGKRAFAYWDIRMNDWYVQPGDYQICIGRSSRDIVCAQAFHASPTKVYHPVYTSDSILGDMLDDPLAKDYIPEILKGSFLELPETDSSDSDKTITAEMSQAMIKYMPVRCTIGFGNGTRNWDDVNRILREINGEL